MMGGVQEENGKAANGWLVIGNGVLLNQSGLIKVKVCFIHITFFVSRSFYVAVAPQIYCS